jgi:hypothetical protein
MLRCMVGCMLRCMVGCMVGCMWMLLVYVPWLGISTTTRHIVSEPIRMLAAVPRQHLVANLAIAVNVYSGNLLELV